MNDQNKFFSRIGGWFRKSTPAELQAVQNPEPPSEVISDGPGGPGGEPPDGHNGHEPRMTFLGRWARRDQAIENLQRGLGALAELLTGIRENMEKQSQRQEELLGQLAGLPEALRAIPEAGRLQGETLKAIHQQIERQSNQQSKLGEVLERISQADSRHASTLDGLQRTVTTLADHDTAISHNLESLGIAMESMSNHSEASARVLENLRDNAARRDGELERVIRRQNTRFTSLLTVAIVLSVGAVTAISVFGYLAYQQLIRMN